MFITSNAGGEAEALERHVRRAADAGVGAHQLAGVRLRGGDEVCEGLVLPGCATSTVGIVATSRDGLQLARSSITSGLQQRARR